MEEELSSQNEEYSLNLHTWIDATTSEGPGRRFALWVQGCSILCAGCCNPEMLPFRPHNEKNIIEIFDWIQKAKQNKQIEGITFLGGEPFDQALPLLYLARKIRKIHLSIMIFSGYTLEELHQKNDDIVEALLSLTDLLVDGAYLEKLHTNKRRWIGSENQNVHFLSTRYTPQDKCWNQPNTLEISFDGKELQISGFPLWSREIARWKK